MSHLLKCSFLPAHHKLGHSTEKTAAKQSSWKETLLLTAEHQQKPTCNPRRGSAGPLHLCKPASTPETPPGAAHTCLLLAPPRRLVSPCYSFTCNNKQLLVCDVGVARDIVSPLPTMPAPLSVLCLCLSNRLTVVVMLDSASYDDHLMSPGQAATGTLSMVEFGSDTSISHTGS